MSVEQGRPIRLIRTSMRDEPMDTAVSHALLRRVSDGLEPETLRLYRPQPVVAFGPKDRLAPGYAGAVEAARAQGFGALDRLAGGRAAVFHEETIAFAWCIPEPAPRLTITERFEALASIMAAAFQSLGVDARVGEVPGEYCPGEFSVNARDRTKLMGVGQRVVAHAAHVGGVVVVGRSALVRDVLVPVYASLDLEWDPATVGSLQDEQSAISWAEGERAIVAEFAARHDLREEEGFNAETLALAEELRSRHVVAAPAGR
jgi:lipoate-protein ligase A